METIYLIEWTAKDDTFEYKSIVAAYSTMKKACIGLQSYAQYLLSNRHKRIDRGYTIEALGTPPQTRDGLKLYRCEFENIEHGFSITLLIKHILLD